VQRSNNKGVGIVTGTDAKKKKKKRGTSGSSQGEGIVEERGEEGSSLRNIFKKIYWETTKRVNTVKSYSSHQGLLEARLALKRVSRGGIGHNGPLF